MTLGLWPFILIFFCILSTEIPVTNTVKEADLAIPDLVDTVVPNIQSADLVVPSSESADIVVTRIEPAEVVFTKTEAGDVVGIKNDYGDVLVTKTEGPKDVFVLEKPSKLSHSCFQLLLL